MSPFRYFLQYYKLDNLNTLLSILTIKIKVRGRKMCEECLITPQLQKEINGVEETIKKIKQKYLLISGDFHRSSLLTQSGIIPPSILS